MFRWFLSSFFLVLPLSCLSNLLVPVLQASIPSEALQPFWTDVYRKTWSVKLYTTKSIAETFQVKYFFPTILASHRFLFWTETLVTCIQVSFACQMYI